MTMHTTGWVEVRDPSHSSPSSMSPNPESHWAPVIYLQPLISKYCVTFGHTVDWESVYASTQPGLPTDASSFLQDRYAEDQTDFGELASPPIWATWSTWKVLGWNALPATDWETLQRILDVVAQRFGDDNVRVIIWTLTNM